MASYNELEVNWGNQQVLFVTRGRSKPFTEEEAVNYLKARDEALGATPEPYTPIVPDKVIKQIEKRLEKKSTFQIPDDKHRRAMFRRDLRQGIDFCMTKYGATREEIEAESLRIAKKETRNA